MKTLATIGDNCVDIYPQLNKAFSGGNAVNVAVYCTRYGIQPGCITWVGDDDYGTKLKQDLARMGVDISHVHTKHGVTAQTQVELHDNDRVFGDYTEGVMADFALSEEDYAWLAQIGPTLKEKGLIFVGLDIIGDRLTEINVTSPTCIREIEAEFPVSITGMLMDAIEARLQQQ